ncbi:MAG: glycerol-3-phosphate acyltransferase [Coriobacteriaceae bacterium]|nr:glycerol-3-phosphate acyltransferase [Coriobacteriaceae bacterium]
MRLAMPALVACAIAYFVCGIPFGMLIARSQGVDVRRTGSGNIGATNVGRSVGARAAGLTLLLDAGKGWLCTGLAVWAFSSFFVEAKALAPGQPFDWVLTCVYGACVAGHVFSPYLGFCGGKGIAVGFGAACGLNPLIAAGLLAVFLAFALPTRFVSLGSTCAAVSLVAWAAILGYSPAAIAPMLVVAACVVWAHRGNIRKLAHHEEKRFSFHHGEGKPE